MNCLVVADFEGLLSGRGYIQNRYFCSSGCKESLRGLGLRAINLGMSLVLMVVLLIHFMNVMGWNNPFGC